MPPLLKGGGGQPGALSTAVKGVVKKTWLACGLKEPCTSDSMVKPVLVAHGFLGGSSGNIGIPCCGRCVCVCERE